MYRFCPSSTAPLGENRLLESFPIGRRVAFDPMKGRLWILCGGCRSWNLAPIEERWEPVEEAERLFAEAEGGGGVAVRSPPPAGHGLRRRIPREDQEAA